MFIINLTYKAELSEIDKHLEDHISYLAKQYAAGNFLASGRKVPRTGGIILANVKSKSQVMEIINQDPFRVNNVSDYDITEFVPSKTCEELKFLVE